MFQIMLLYQTSLQVLPKTTISKHIKKYSIQWMQIESLYTCNWFQLILYYLSKTVLQVISSVCMSLLTYLQHKIPQLIPWLNNTLNTLIYNWTAQWLFWWLLENRELNKLIHSQVNTPCVKSKVHLKKHEKCQLGLINVLPGEI